MNYGARTRNHFRTRKLASRYKMVKEASFRIIEITCKVHILRNTMMQWRRVRAVGWWWGFCLSIVDAEEDYFTGAIFFYM